MMYFYQALMILSPSICLLSGLFASSIVGVLYCMILYKRYYKVEFLALRNHKCEVALMLWVMISCIWSPDFFGSAKQYLILMFFVISSYSIMQKSVIDDINLSAVLYFPLLIGSLLALVIFGLEYVSEGYISIAFRNYFQNSIGHYFALHFLDRGCSFLTMISWPVLYFLIKKRYFFFSFLYYVCLLYALSISDSFASYLALICGTVAFTSTLLLRKFALYALMCVVTLTAILFPIIAKVQSPLLLSSQYYSLPDSGKHRLFIWKFTSLKILEKPILGWGFNSSRDIPVDDEVDLIYFQKYKWHPLPLHPHNCFLHIWLECGIVGLILFTVTLLKILYNSYLVYLNQRNVVWLSIMTGCFINYLVIAMVSYGLWQIWWVATYTFTMMLVYCAKDAVPDTIRRGISKSSVFYRY